MIVGISSALPKDPTQSASVHLSAGLQHKFFPNQDVETERIGARPIFELMGAAKSAFGETRVPLSGFVLKNAPADKAVKPMLSTQPMSVQVMLHRNNEAAMVPLLNSIYDRNSPIFHRYLSVTDRREKFSPKIENFRAVGAYFQSQGLKIIDHQVDRTSLTVSGTVGHIQKAFGVRLSEYFEPTDQRSWHFVDRAPEVPTSISPLILEVQNLNTVALPQPNARFVKETPSNLSPALLDIWPFSDQGIPAGEIRKMYGMGLGLKFSDGTPVGGQGEKLALVEFGGYNSDVVAAYIHHSLYDANAVYAQVAVGLKAIPLKNVLIGGADGSVNSVEQEVELDIEMVQAMADHLDQLKIYEAKDSYDAVLSQIRDDNDCRQTSISYGSVGSIEGQSSSTNLILIEMALQGQSVFISSGDTGANNGTNSLTVEFPANLPYAIAVGGTEISLNTDPFDPSYLEWSSETTWNRDGQTSATGGGISKNYASPQWQYDYLKTHSDSFGTDPSGRTDLLNWRMVPDISLNGSPHTGYWVWAGDDSHTLGSHKVGGTSASAPLMAAFNALVNQARQKGQYNEPIGLLTPSLYQLASDATTYGNDFHDINDSTTNAWYKAVNGLDAATGLGTIKGRSLLTDLQSVGQNTLVSNFTVTPPGGSTGHTATVGAGTTVRFAVSTQTDLTVGLSDAGYVAADLYQFDKPSDKLVASVRFTSNRALIDLAVPTVPQRTVFFYRVDVRAHGLTKDSMYHDLFYVSVTVDPATINGVTMNPPTIYSGDFGDTTVATLSMNSPAPADLPFSIQLSPFSDYIYDRNVTILKGQTSVQIPIKLASHFPSAYSVHVVATYTGRDAKWGQVASDFNVVTAPKVTSISLNPATVVGGASVTGTLQLSDTAISNGVPCSIFYANGDGVLSGPTTVTVPVGQSTAAFTINTVAPAATVTELVKSGTVFGFETLGQGSVIVTKPPVPTKPTTITFTSTKPVALAGDLVTFNIQVTADSGTPTGLVHVSTSSSFTFDVVLDSNGKGSFASPDNLSIPAGDYDMVASFPGDDKWSASSVHLHQIFQAGSEVKLTDTPNPSLVTQVVVFTALITADKDATPTGTVQFVDKGATPFMSGGTVLGSSTVDATGKATFAYNKLTTIDNHNIVAIYSGDGTYRGGYSYPLNHVVNFTLVDFRITSAINPSFAGQPVVFTGKVTLPAGCSPPEGTVYLQDQDSIIATTNMTVASNGVVKFSIANLSVGTHNIGGFFSGTAGLFGGATPFNQVVNAATGQTVLKVDATVARGANGYTVSVTVSNIGQATAGATKLTAGKLGAATGIGLPISLGDIAPGTSITIPMSFPLTAGKSGLATSFTVSGSYANGSINYTKRVTLP